MLIEDYGEEGEVCLRKVVWDEGTCWRQHLSWKLT